MTHVPSHSNENLLSCPWSPPCTTKIICFLRGQLLISISPWGLDTPCGAFARSTFNRSFVLTECKPATGLLACINPGKLVWCLICQSVAAFSYLSLKLQLINYLLWDSSNNHTWNFKQVPVFVNKICRFNIFFWFNRLRLVVTFFTLVNFS